MTALDLRQKLLNSNRFRSRILDVALPQLNADGTEGEPLVIKVKVKQPSVEERNAIFSAAKVSKDGSVSGGNLSTGALAIIHCCRDPDSDEAIFTLSDLDLILHTPAGGWVDKLSAEVMDVLVEATGAAKK